LSTGILDLGGCRGPSKYEYEYGFAVSADDLRKVLGGKADVDLGDLVCAHAAARICGPTRARTATGSTDNKGWAAPYGAAHI